MSRRRGALGGLFGRRGERTQTVSGPGLRLVDGGVEATVVADGALALQFGAVIVPDGGVRRLGAATGQPPLEMLPGARKDGERLSWSAPADAPRLPRATAFVSWPARFSYAAFLLETLPVALTLAAREDLAVARPLSPPLMPWQGALMHQVLGPAADRLFETDAPLVLADALEIPAFDEATLAAGQAAVRARLLAEPAADGPERVFIARRSPQSRLLNEEAIEAELEARGFAIIHPDRMTVARQLALCRTADVIVGVAGPGLANLLVAQAGATVIELRPEDASDRYRRLAEAAEARWSCCEAAESAALGETVRSWSLPLGEVLERVDQLD